MITSILHCPSEHADDRFWRRAQWSPEQIAGWLKRTYPGELQKQVSHETIYRSLFIQAHGVLKKELLEHLRARRTVRRSRHASMKRNGLGQIKNAVSISERPPSVEDRAVPGHWEGDLIGGSGNSYSRISENVSINIRLGRWTEAGSSFVERKPKYEIPSPSTIRAK